MLCVLAAASFVSFSSVSQPTARHRATTGSCTALIAGRTSLLTAAASPPSEGHCNHHSPALASALSRRAALLSGAAVAVAAGAPPAAWAGSDNKARAQMESSLAALDDLLDRYDEVLATTPALLCPQLWPSPQPYAPVPPPHQVRRGGGEGRRQRRAARAGQAGADEPAAQDR